MDKSAPPKTLPIWVLVPTVIFAMTCIVAGDAAGTVLTGGGFAPGFVAWTRFALAAVLIAPICGLSLKEMRQFLDWRLYLRAMLIVGGISSILTALQTEPLANAFGGFFIGPIVAYFLSSFLLGERISLVRTVLLLVSFLGVLLVVRPGFGMSIGMGFALLAGTYYGAYLVATRWLAGTFRPRFLLFSQLVIGAVMLLPFTATQTPDMTPAFAGLILLSAVGSATGNFLLVVVSRTTPAGVIAPLIYSQIVAALVIGWAVFGDIPDVLSLIGLVTIIAGGVSSVIFARRSG